MKGITRTLSRYVSMSRFDELPAEVRHEGVRAFVNWVGCAARGSREDIVNRALEGLMEFNGAAAATVVGRRERLDALNAAFINAMSSSALAFYDTHVISVCHPTGPVAAALLALAERRPLTGKEFLHALILGMEIQCRVGNVLCAAPAKCQVGLSMPGLVGGIGAAVGAAKVMNLDESGIATAIGHAANQASGLKEALGTTASALMRGLAARSGLMAAMFTTWGYTCSDTMIEGTKGFAVSYGQRSNPEAALEKLGQAYEVLNIAYKPYPGGSTMHPTIDACLEIVRTEKLDAAQIERIELTVNPIAAQSTNRPDPKNRSEALQSIQHWAAASLIYKAAGIAEIAEAVIHDPAVADLRRKVVLITLASAGREAASVRVILKGGRSVGAHVLHGRGSVERPLTDDDITEKTRAQLQTVYPAQAADEIVTECWRIEEYPLVERLCERLAIA